MARTSKAENRLGIRGWLNPVHYNVERWAYVLQRVTGIGILAYFMGHMVETGTIVGGPEAWLNTLNLTQNPAGHVILIFLILALGFHGLNGIRLILTEFGILLGKPSRPDYPYRPKALNPTQKACIWLSIVLTIVAAIYGFAVLFGVRF